MKETRFRAWIIDYETEKGYMYHWNEDFFSDMSPVTAWFSSFPDPDDTDVTLMQFTGKRDMNDKRIYEDDIIRKEICDPDDPVYGFYGAIGVVEEDPHNMGWYINDIDGENEFYNWEGINFNFNEIEVIGNVHENPDLIGK